MMQCLLKYTKDSVSFNIYYLAYVTLINFWIIGKMLSVYCWRKEIILLISPLLVSGFSIYNNICGVGELTL